MRFFRNLFRRKHAIIESRPGNTMLSQSLLIENNVSETVNENNDQPQSTIPQEEKKEDVINYKELPPYEPSLDLRDYEYPTIDLFGSETRNFLVSFRETKGTALLPLIWSVKNNQLFCKDLSDLKNIFICGSQETGKTSFLNQLLISFLLTKHPAQLKLLIAGIKPLELRIYRLLEKHFLTKLPGEEEAVIQEPAKLQNALNGVCIEMDNRYDLLKKADTRNISEYNQKFVARKLNPQKGHQFLPCIVLIIDDLPGFALYGKELIQPQLERIISNGYKVGVFTCITTNPFSGHSLSNSVLHLTEQRVVFNLYDKDDYKKFFNSGRSNKYLEKGEFLFNEGAAAHSGICMDIQFSDIEKVIEHISDQRGYPQAFMLPEYLNEDELSVKDFDFADSDPLFEDAARLIVQNQIGSTSLLQRRMKLGYNRTGRLMDQLEAFGIVGPNQGSKAREVLIKTEKELDNLISKLK
jgi:S-DNA-T family DNA segregation ATPase FtsK/SpoIIIE